MILKVVCLDLNYSEGVAGVYQLSCDSDWTIWSLIVPYHFNYDKTTQIYSKNFASFRAIASSNKYGKDSNTR
jgi:hypothetical protein